MTLQEKSLGKKRGRPAIGKGVQVNAMVRPSLIAAIDAYCDQTGAKRTDAVRALIKLGLKAYNESLT